MAAKTIAIVEDELMLQTALKIELERAGYNVLSAYDGRDGLELIQKKKPDLVLLDIMLPRMTGLEILKKLQSDKKTKNIPVFILSNLGQDVEQEEGIELGAKMYYIKMNLNLKDLLKQIEKTLS